MLFEGQGRSVGRSVKDVAQGFRCTFDELTDLEIFERIYLKK